jgi:hypothetical protein
LVFQENEAICNRREEGLVDSTTFLLRNSCSVICEFSTFQQQQQQQQENYTFAYSSSNSANGISSSSCSSYSERIYFCCYHEAMEGEDNQTAKPAKMMVNG